MNFSLKPAIQDNSIRPLPGSAAFTDIQRYHRWLRDLQIRIPGNAHLLYYQADTEIVLGETENALRSFEALARKIPRQPWVWAKLALAYPAGSEARLDAMLKALSLYRPNDAYAVTLLSDLARECQQRYPAAAKNFLEQACALRTAQTWGIKAEDQALLRAWEHIPSTPPPKAEQEAASLRAERRVGLQPSTNSPHKNFVGSLRIPQDRDFGFVGDVHVPARLIRQKNLCHDDRVAGTAQEKMDLKKNKPGWIAVQIEKGTAQKSQVFSGNSSKPGLHLHKPPLRGASGNGA